MYVFALSSRIFDRARKEEELVGRGAKGGLMEDDGIPIIGVAGVQPGRQVPGDQQPEFSLGEGLRGVGGEWLRHERKECLSTYEPSLNHRSAAGRRQKSRKTDTHDFSVTGWVPSSFTS